MHWLVLSFKRQRVIFLRTPGWLHFPHFIFWELTALGVQIYTATGSSWIRLLHCNCTKLPPNPTVIIYLVPIPGSLLSIAGPYHSYMYVQNLGLNLSLGRATTKSPTVVTYLLSIELAMLLVLYWLWFCQLSSRLVPCWLVFVLHSGVWNLVSLLSTTCLGRYLGSRFNTFIYWLFKSI